MRWGLLAINGLFALGALLGSWGLFTVLESWALFTVLGSWGLLAVLEIWALFTVLTIFVVLTIFAFLTIFGLSVFLARWELFAFLKLITLFNGRQRQAIVTFEGFVQAVEIVLSVKKCDQIILGCRCVAFQLVGRWWPSPVELNSIDIDGDGQKCECEKLSHGCGNTFN